MSARFDKNQITPANYISNHYLDIDSANLKKVDLEVHKSNLAAITLLENDMILDCNEAAC